MPIFAIGEEAARSRTAGMNETAKADVFDLSPLHEAQRGWAALPIQARLAVLRRTRFAMSRMGNALSDAMPADLCRTAADTRVAEVLPMLAACHFLEQKAEEILRVRRLGRRGLPFLLSGVKSEVQRVPYGVVLVLGPANYPLFLPGVQTLQGLAAGNAVLLKPGNGGAPVARLFAEALYGAGLPRGLLHVTDDSIESGEEALRRSVDKVIFTGSAQNARKVMRVCADRLIPCVVEASGCDAVVVLPSADLKRVVKAVAFGMRLNGSATCMAPRRMLLLNASEARKRMLVGMLSAAFDQFVSVRIAESTRGNLRDLLDEAKLLGAHVHGSIDAEQRPILVTEAKPKMRLARVDVFAPVLSIIDVSSEAEAVAAQEGCPFGLTASVFGEEGEARRLATVLNVGTVLINDVIVATADPRVPFGGRRGSGFGTTRGTEGLLEMTAAKVVSAQRSKSLRFYEATGEQHRELFEGIIQASHSQTIGQRVCGVMRVIRAAIRFEQK
jgi:acyl-CoA reductase-like NAD-dependent aldehyde dehydrogenase